MKFFQVVSLCAGVALLISACSEGSRSRLRGSQCPENFEPIPMNVPHEQQLSVVEGTVNPIPDGEYTYEGADLYYISKDDMRVLVQESRHPDGIIRPTVSCVRNASAQLAETFTVGVAGVTSLKIKPSAKIEFEAAQFGFQIQNYRLTALAEPMEASEKPDVPSKIYSGAGVHAFMVRKGLDVFGRELAEIRSSGTTPDGGTYVLGIHFVRTVPAPPPAAKP